MAREVVGTFRRRETTRIASGRAVATLEEKVQVARAAGYRLGMAGARLPRRVNAALSNQDYYWLEPEDARPASVAAGME